MRGDTYAADKRALRRATYHVSEEPAFVVRLRNKPGAHALAYRVFLARRVSRRTFLEATERPQPALNLMRLTLKHHENVVVVPVNPWDFTVQEQLLRGCSTSAEMGVLSAPDQAADPRRAEAGGGDLLPLAQRWR